MITDELKHCPFCGRTDYLAEYPKKTECGYCGGSAPSTDVWNKRVEPSELPEWAIKQIHEIRESVMKSRFGDRKWDMCYDSETYAAIRAGIYRYLTLVMTLRREDVE